MSILGELDGEFDVNIKIITISEIVEERNLALRDCDLKLSSLHSLLQNNEENIYYDKNAMKSELVKKCSVMTKCKNAFLNSDSDENKVLYHKIKGNCYKYLVGLENVDDAKKYENKKLAKKAYMSAYEIQLDPSNYIRLGLLLDFSVFYYEICKDKDAAHATIQEAINGVANNTEELSEALKLMKKSITEKQSLWWDQDNATDEKSNDGLIITDADQIIN